MNKIFSLCRIAWALLFVALSLTGCRKDLCYEHEDHVLAVRVMAVADWELVWERPYDYNWREAWDARFGFDYDELNPSVPDGIRVLSYTPSGGHIKHNLQTGGGRLALERGLNDLLFYNNDTYHVVFTDLASTATATATTRTVTRSTFQGLHANERTVSPPDALFGHFVEGYMAEMTLEDVELPIVMRPLTYTYIIRYNIVKGLEHVKQTRGAIAGMAESVFLKNGQTADEAVTLLYDCTMRDFGAEAMVVSFGIPGYPDKYYNRAPETRVEHYALNLECCLTNGEVRTYEFDITDQMKGQPRGGVIEVGDIIVEEPGKGSGGGFSVDVTDWGEYEDVEIEF